MKLNKLILGILAAVAAFTLGISAYAAVGLALSYIPTKSATSVAPERNIPETVSVPAAPIPMEPIFVGPSSEKEISGEEPSVEEFDPAGEYYLNEEELPKAFADIDLLEITTHEDVEEACDRWISSPIAPKGSLQAKAAFKFDRIAIGGKEIAFQTATVDGVSFKFTGRFVNQAYCETDGDVPDLKGRLIKIKDNKWAAEIEAEFYMQCGC